MSTDLTWAHLIKYGLPSEFGARIDKGNAVLRYHKGSDGKYAVSVEHPDNKHVLFYITSPSISRIDEKGNQKTVEEAASLSECLKEAVRVKACRVNCNNDAIWPSVFNAIATRSRS